MCFSHLSQLTPALTETRRLLDGGRVNEDPAPLLSLLSNALNAAKRYAQQPPACPMEGGLLPISSLGQTTSRILSPGNVSSLSRSLYLDSLGRALCHGRRRAAAGSPLCQLEGGVALTRAVMFRSCLSVAFWSLWSLGMLC